MSINKTITMAASNSATSSRIDTPRIAVPAEYFLYVGEAEKDGNSLYRCLKCPTGIAGKKISALLKERVAALHVLEQQVAANAQASTSAASESGSGLATTASISTTADDEDFFSLLRAKRQAQQTQSHLSPDDPRHEVDKFFHDDAAGLDSLEEYPYIKKLYVTLNTGLPSSASVERLFSLGGRIFTPLRSRMTSEHFEMMMFLRMAHHF